MRARPSHATATAYSALLATAPGGLAPLLQRTTPEQRAEWQQRQWWRKVKLLAACPSRRALRLLMESNQGVRAE